MLRTCLRDQCTDSDWHVERQRTQRSLLQCEQQHHQLIQRALWARCVRLLLQQGLPGFTLDENRGGGAHHCCARSQGQRHDQIENHTPPPPHVWWCTTLESRCQEIPVLTGMLLSL